ncbi:hypothetical protein GCM10028784_21040 [Myceligenerans cantabricum]
MSTAASPDAPGAATFTSLRPDDPRHLGPYRLLGVLGSGGMGTVYLGRTPDGETVAVKVVRLDLTGEQEFRERFAREVDAARRVDGSHTAELVYADPHGRLPWMATAFVLGPSLREAINEGGPLDVGTLRALGLGLAEGLTTIHAAGLVHRDLKPGNVLLTSGGARIIDFGIARALEATAITSVSQVLGTASYMSPEQVRGFEAGPASDVFSFGCLLVYAATGVAPFGTGHAESVAYRVVHTEPDLDGVPSELLVLVKDCLAKEPSARPTPQEIVARITSRTSRPVTWQTTPALNTMIAARAKAVRSLEAQVDAEPTVPMRPLTDDATAPSPVTSSRTASGTTSVPVRHGPLKVVAAALAGILLPVGAWMLYDRLAHPAGTPFVADGWYTMEGEPLDGDPSPAHFVEIVITSEDPGEQVLVGYAATVITGEPPSGASDDGGPQSVDTTRVGNEEGFLVETPWRGKIPIDESVLAVGATGSGAEGDVSCSISVDVETVVTSTSPGTASCVTPFDGDGALGENIKASGLTPPSPSSTSLTAFPTDPTTSHPADDDRTGGEEGTVGEDDVSVGGTGTADEEDGSTADDGAADDPADDDETDESTGDDAEDPDDETDDQTDSGSNANENANENAGSGNNNSGGNGNGNNGNGNNGNNGNGKGRRGDGNGRRRAGRPPRERPSVVQPRATDRPPGPRCRPGHPADEAGTSVAASGRKSVPGGV